MNDSMSDSRFYDKESFDIVVEEAKKSGMPVLGVRQYVLDSEALGYDILLKTYDPVIELKFEDFQARVWANTPYDAVLFLLTDPLKYGERSCLREAVIA